MENKYILLSGVIIFIVLSLISYVSVSDDEVDKRNDRILSRVILSFFVSVALTGGAYYYLNHIREERFIFSEENFD